MISEDSFARLVAKWLSDSFSDVESEVTLPSGNRVDFVARTPFESYVIEVENSWHSAYSGIGQAIMYAAETGHQPVVVFPADHVDQTEMELIDHPHIVTL